MKVPERVEHLHALVHPGFSLGPREEVKQKHIRLFDRYEERAATMGDRDAMIAITFHPPTERTDNERFVMRQMQRLKDALRTRMVLIARGLSFVNDTPQGRADLQRAKDVLLARGLRIDHDTQVEACGETLSHCVANVSQMMFHVYALMHPVVIRAHATNLGVRDGETLDEERRRLQLLALEEGQPYAPEVLVDWSVPKAKR